MLYLREMEGGRGARKRGKLGEGEREKERERERERERETEPSRIITVHTHTSLNNLQSPLLLVYTWIISVFPTKSPFFVVCE